MQLNEFLFYYLLLYYILFASFIQLCATFFVSFYPEREIKPTERKKQQQQHQQFCGIYAIYTIIYQINLSKKQKTRSKVMRFQNKNLYMYTINKEEEKKHNKEFESRIENVLKRKINKNKTRFK